MAYFRHFLAIGRISVNLGREALPQALYGGHLRLARGESAIRLEGERYRGVPHELAQRLEVAAGLEHVGRKRVTQLVRADGACLPLERPVPDVRLPGFPCGRLTDVLTGPPCFSAS